MIDSFLSGFGLVLGGGIAFGVLIVVLAVVISVLDRR